MTEEKIDKGHIKLIYALQLLLSRAEDFQFHDFKNTDYAAPKMALVEALGALLKRVTDGDFDN